MIGRGDAEGVNRLPPLRRPAGDLTAVPRVASSIRSMNLRISGRSLRLVRLLASLPVSRRLVWRAVASEFRLAELEALPADQRLPVGESARPVQARPPHTWEDRQYGAPAVRPGSGAELQAAYRSGRATPVEVIARLLDRLEHADFGPARYSPFVTLHPERARAAAQASAERWQRGAPMGPLDGLPVPVKDHVNIATLPTFGGCRYSAGPAAADAFLVARLADAGAVLPGKTHATEWGLNALGFSEHADLPHNVYRTDRAAGGSSTGSAVAVALGLAPAAIASDGGGSIRTPSCFNGVFGLKPTFERIGRTGDVWGSGTMHTLGPIGRSTPDLVELLAGTAARDPDDTGTWTAADYPGVYEAWRRAVGRGISGCRIGVVRSELAEAAAPIASACDAALAAFEREGAVLVDVEIPLARHAAAVGAIIIASEAVASLSDVLPRVQAQTGDEFRLVAALMQNVTAQQFLGCERTRRALRYQVAQVLMQVDLIALPASAALPPRFELAETRRGTFDSAATNAALRFSMLANLTGLPACSIPGGMHDGLPVGLQLVGDAWDEASVTAACAHAERIGLADIPLPPGFRSLVE